MFNYLLAFHLHSTCAQQKSQTSKQDNNRPLEIAVIFICYLLKACMWHSKKPNNGKRGIPKYQLTRRVKWVHTFSFLELCESESIKRLKHQSKNIKGPPAIASNNFNSLPYLLTVAQLTLPTVKSCWIVVFWMQIMFDEVFQHFPWGNKTIKDW